MSGFWRKKTSESSQKRAILWMTYTETVARLENDQKEQYRREKRTTENVMVG